MSTLSIGNLGYRNSWKIVISIMQAALFCFCFDMNSIALLAFVNSVEVNDSCILFYVAG